MNTELSMSQLRRQFNPWPSAFIPDELIVEILCLLNVKSLMKMKCVSKSWNTIISDPKFVKMHLNQSSQNSNFCAVSNYNKISKQKDDYSFISFSINDLLENRLNNLPNDPYYRLIDKDCHEVVGSCNGLVCLIGHNDEHKRWLRIWNPATRTISDKLEYFYNNIYKLKFIFGYDNTTDTYKVVALDSGNDSTAEVRVLSFGDNIWRNIKSLSGKPRQFCSSMYGLYCVVPLNCTVNWLAFIMDGDFDLKLVIISLDLGTEAHTHFLPPPDHLESTILQKDVCVLMNSLCFYHDLKGTDLVIWMMTKFGDEKTWTQFLKFSYQDLHMNRGPGSRCFNLFNYGDTLVFANYLEDRVILYNLGKNRVEKIHADKEILWLSMNNYMESLVSTC